MPSLLIDNDRLRMLCVTPTLEQAVCWADLLIPSSDFTVLGLEPKNFKLYTDYEMRLLYLHQAGTALSDKFDSERLREGLSSLAGSLPLDETPLDDLVARLGYNPNQQEATHVSEPVKKKKPAGKKKSEGAPVAKRGTATAIIRELMETHFKEFNEIPPRADIINRAGELGIGKATAGTQYAKAKKLLLQAS